MLRCEVRRYQRLAARNRMRLVKVAFEIAGADAAVEIIEPDGFFGIVEIAGDAVRRRAGAAEYW